MEKRAFIKAVLTKVFRKVRFYQTFTLAEAAGPVWYNAKPSLRRQAAKEIKISILLKTVTGIVFVDKTSSGTLIYKRVPTKDS